MRDFAFENTSVLFENPNRGSISLQPFTPASTAAPRGKFDRELQKSSGDFSCCCYCESSLSQSVEAIRIIPTDGEAKPRDVKTSRESFRRLRPSVSLRFLTKRVSQAARQSVSQSGDNIITPRHGKRSALCEDGRRHATCSNCNNQLATRRQLQRSQLVSAEIAATSTTAQ